MKKIIIPIFIIASIGLFYLYTKSSFYNSNPIELIDKEELIFGVHPYLDKETLVNKFQPLVNYLSHTINKKITLKISPSYTEHLELVGNDSYDLSYVGPSIYIQMVDKYNEKFILASMTTYDLPFFNGIIFVRANSSIYSLKDLKNQSFAFGKEASTMSSIVPKVMLEEVGIELYDLKKYQHLKNHDDVVKYVLSGEFSAGAVKEAIFDKYKEAGLREIARSRHISEHVFLAANSMPIKTKKQIEALLLNITKTQQGRKILHNIKPKSNRLKHTRDDSFNTLREYMNRSTRFKWDFVHDKEHKQVPTH